MEGGRKKVLGDVESLGIRRGYVSDCEEKHFEMWGGFGDEER